MVGRIWPTCAVPGLPGRAENLMTFKGQAPGNRMLAAAAANDENFQYANFNVSLRVRMVV